VGYGMGATFPGSQITSRPPAPFDSQAQDSFILSFRLVIHEDTIEDTEWSVEGQDYTAR